jgi:hypothetical protein
VRLSSSLEPGSIYGSAISTDTAGNKSITGTTFCSCGENLNCHGTVSHLDLVTGFYRRVNFSACQTSQEAVFASVLGLQNSIQLFEYVTVWNCSGATALRSEQAGRPSISYCNFYSNTVLASEALLSCAEAGMIVSRCIFYRSGPEFEVITAAALKFEVSNCVFSGGLPDGDYYASTVDNTYNVITPSIAIDHLDTYYCPGVAQTSDIGTEEFTHSSTDYFRAGHIMKTAMFTFLLF